MKDGFIKVKSISPAIKPAEIQFNTEIIITSMSLADEEGVNVLLLPELSITGFSCQDLFFSDLLLEKALCGLKAICSHSQNLELITIVGLPLSYLGKLYNVAAVIFKGSVLGFVPKINIPNYMSFSEKRYFQSGINIPYKTVISLKDIGENIPFSSKLIFKSESINNFAFGIEICEDLWAPIPPSSYLALGGATLIFNLSASPETLGKSKQRLSYISTLSSRLLCGYIYSNAGIKESCSGNTYSGQCIISECGEIIGENPPFTSKMGCTSEIDIKKIASLRQINSSFITKDDFIYIGFDMKCRTTSLSRIIYKNPFIKNKEEISESSFNDIVNIQTYALAKKIESSVYNKVVYIANSIENDILALFCIVKAFDILKMNTENIYINDKNSDKCHETLQKIAEKYHCSSGYPKTDTISVYSFDLGDFISGNVKINSTNNYILNSSLSKKTVQQCASKIMTMNDMDKFNTDSNQKEDFFDFMLFYTLKFGFGVKKIHRLALLAFSDIYDNNTVCELMKTFYKQLFSNKSRKHLMLESPQIGTVSVSPDSYFKLNFDVSPELWLEEIDSLYV